jgi:hypothetical protein
VIKESAETTKMRIVYDASSSETAKAASLNDCLETGPPLQPLLHNVVVRNRLCPIGLTADVKQAFLKIVTSSDFSGFLTWITRTL